MLPTEVKRCVCGRDLQDADVNFQLLQSHTFLTPLMRIFYLECINEEVALRCPQCPFVITIIFSRCCLLCGMIIYALMFMVCQFFGERSFMNIFFTIEAVLNAVFIGFTFLQKIFYIDFSERKKKKHLFDSCTVWWCCARFDLAQPVLFHSTRWESLPLFWFKERLEADSLSKSLNL